MFTWIRRWFQRATPPKADDGFRGPNPADLGTDETFNTCSSAPDTPVLPAYTLSSLLVAYRRTKNPIDEWWAKYPRSVADKDIRIAHLETQLDQARVFEDQAKQLRAKLTTAEWYAETLEAKLQAAGVLTSPSPE